VPKQLAVIGILGGCIIYLVVDLASGNGQVGTTKRFTPADNLHHRARANAQINTALKAFLCWTADMNVELGALVFALVYAVCTVLFIPGAILTIGAGLIFGNAVGTGPGVFLAFCSVYIGACSWRFAPSMITSTFARVLVRGPAGPSTRGGSGLRHNLY
jgi:hypothetical protein